MNLKQAYALHNLCNVYKQEHHLLQRLGSRTILPAFVANNAIKLALHET